LDGGLGFDYARYDLAGSAIVARLDLGAGIAGDAAGDLYASIEGLVGSEYNDTLTGDAGSNVLEGGAGADTLIGGGGRDVLLGGTGADSMQGGAGDDLYGVDDLGDIVTEVAGEGYDEVYSSVNFGMGAGLETLFMTGSAVFGTGNAGNNAIIGNDADNIIQAGDGDFEFISGAGGNDLLIGGLGHDEIFGGAGADTFRFESVQDAFNGASNSADFIYDFTPGEDKIQLNAAAFGMNSVTTGANFISSFQPQATSGGPTLLYSTQSAYLFYDADGTGSSGPVILAILNGIPNLTAADFMFY
jgi:Ca2+-binding RTX toxin-like protein